MTIDRAIALVEQIVCDRTDKNLSDLQVTILREVWQGKKYLEIADLYGCTEGHAKDVAYLLWQILSQAWGEKITKSNFKTAIKKRLQVINPQLDFTITKNILESNLTEDLNFLGRQQEIADLTNLVEQKHKIIVIQGQGGIGKTTLAKKFLASYNFDLVLEFLMAKETANITSAESLVEEWLKRDFQEEPGKEFGVSLSRLKRHLAKQRVGILIDNLEPALNKNGQLISEQRNYLELLRILADFNLKAVTIITSRDRFCESDLDLHHYRLSGLDLTAWQHFFLGNKIKIQFNYLQEMHRIYGGNAKAMGILSGVIQEDFAKEGNSYWQENKDDPLVETNLKNLVTSQFNRLQTLDRQAYILLCRLGCYRYQDVPHISQAGLLVLLWDIQHNQQKQIIESLRNRSLIEFTQGHYWLHPVIKAEALFRLTTTEWIEVNQKIAQFYTDYIAQINSVQEGLIALEAYYHYLAIADFTTAGKVILASRTNQWGQHLTLGTTLYRLGLSQPLLKAIKQIIERISEPKIYSELNNILGDLYWINGNIKKAIACQDSTIAIATNYLSSINHNSQNKQSNYYWKMLQVDSLLSIGLYQIDLGELELAATFFQQVINLAQQTKHHSWAEKAEICWALVQSYLGNLDVANNITQQYLKLINNQKNKIYNTGRFAYFIQILGQTLVNLQQYEIATNILEKAIAFCQESHYVQTKAKSLTGLAIIQRKLCNFTVANEYHLQAIQLLENISAKCDLAEAYYQYAVTLKENNNLAVSNFYGQNAIQLFQQIKAPKQIKKVKQINIELS